MTTTAKNALGTIGFLAAGAALVPVVSIAAAALLWAAMTFASYAFG